MRTENQQNAPNGLSFIEQARRAQIIEAAIDVIVSLGYARASLAQIAIKAGISKGVISYHFAGKEELIQQVITHVYATATCIMAPRIEAEASVSSKLTAYIKSNLEFIRIHHKYIVTLQQIWYNHRAEDAAAPLIANKHEGGLDDLERLLRYGQEAGEFRVFDSRTMAMVIRNAIDMVPHLMTAQFDFDIDAFAQELVSLFSRATARET